MNETPSSAKFAAFVRVIVETAQEVDLSPRDRTVAACSAALSLATVNAHSVPELRQRLDLVSAVIRDGSRAVLEKLPEVLEQRAADEVTAELDRIVSRTRRNAPVKTPAAPDDPTEIITIRISAPAAMSADERHEAALRSLADSYGSRLGLPPGQQVSALIEAAGKLALEMRAQGQPAEDLLARVREALRAIETRLQP